MKKSNVIHIDPLYMTYRRMWKENRWQFSGELVKLTIKLNKTGGLDPIEQHKMSTIQRVIDENDGKWTEGYEYDDGVLGKVKEKKKN